MRRIAHVSDLHFGREDAGIAKDLRRDLDEVRADLVVVSGDLTQRARRRQFEAARAYLDSLPATWMAVPGNHDIPLYDFARRALDPFGRYRRIVCGELAPRHEDDEVTVLGLNTVLPRAWKNGIARTAALDRLHKWSANAGSRARIVFAHHPFARPAASRAELVRGWQQAVLAMEGAGVDLLLTGHQHRSGHFESRAYVADGPHRLVIVRAGTCISHRRRGEPNSYNLIHVEPDRFIVEARHWTDGSFRAAATQAFPRRAWTEAPAQAGPDGNPQGAA
ncbi:MAG TPA: metallophosphoesterase [Candidatus Thermoplasmatota archaeon]|nr:metallophosphoesterase [Candidatus Thermoplasmatota archaeon]